MRVRCNELFAPNPSSPLIFLVGGTSLSSQKIVNLGGVNLSWVEANCFQRFIST